jgi:hypothetical protein
MERYSYIYIYIYIYMERERERKREIGGAGILPNPPPYHK